METQITINIDDYLSDSEKKEYAIEAFKESVKKELFKSKSETIQSDSEIQRIIGNISSEIIFQEVQSYIPDFKERLIERTKKAILSDSISYHVFKKKDSWDKEESIAISYMRQTIESNKAEFQERIKSEMQSYDLKSEISEQVSGFFESLAGNMYALSELFLNKNQKHNESN